MLVVGYDFGLKRLWVGPLVMGMCRGLNVLLGASVVGANVDPPGGFAWLGLAIAAGIGVYVIGISLVARSEAESFSRRMVLVGVGCMVVGLGWLAGLVWWLPDARFDDLTTGQKVAVSSMLVVVFSPVFVRSIMACANRSTRALRGAVTVALLGLILIDASLCFAVAARSPAYAVAVSLLLVPSLLLGRRADAT
jgi:4-hydroxybenzoate polyprenyltransferase